MSEFLNTLLQHLPVETHETFIEQSNFRIYKLNLANDMGFLLVSDGLSSRSMPVPDKYVGHEHVELSMYLPNYWEFGTDNERYAWTTDVMMRLINHGLNEDTWFGPGHTIGLSGYEDGFSSATKMNHLMLVEPISFNEEFQKTFDTENPRTIYTILPLFAEEADYKQAKGAHKLIRKLDAKGVSDKIDDFRYSTQRTRFRLF